MKARQHIRGGAHRRARVSTHVRRSRGRRRSPSGGRAGRWWGAALSVAAVLAGLTGTLPARAQTDGAFSVAGDRWDGLSELVGLASEMGITVAAPSRIDVDTLDPAADALLVVHPTLPLPTAGLTEFLRRGGRMAIADDFGEGEAFLASYHFERRVPSFESQASLRRNPGLPVARALYDHPLTAGVQHLVANHPSVVRHPELAPLIAFDDSGDALLATGAIGEGRLVVLSDPSVLINNMLALQGNRRFAQNLLAYLDGGRGGRLFIGILATPIVGRRGERSGVAGLDHLQDWLSDLASAELPVDAVRALYATLAVLLLFFVAATMPRKTPYRAELMLPDAGSGDAPLGRVGLFARPGANLLHPALVYGEELRAALRARLGLPSDAPGAALTTALGARGMPPEALGSARRLLQRLAELEEASLDAKRTPKIGHAELRRMVDTGQRLLALLQGPSEMR